MRRQIGSSLAALAIAARANMPCWAEEVKEPRFEVYMGADSDGRTANVTSSLVWSVFGPVTQPGFRLKLDGLADIYGDTDASLFSAKFMAADLKNVSNLMAGYQFNYGSAQIKLYAGAASSVQTRIYYSIGQILQESSFGAAAAFQAYWPMSDRIWASLNVTWVQPNDSTWIYSRSAYEIYRTPGGLRIAAGAEVNFTLAGDPTFKEGRSFDVYKKYFRGGALLNLRYGSNDLSLSAGLSQANEESMSRPYAGISYGRQF